MKLDCEEIRKKFPFFENNSDLVYVDNAATTQKFSSVIEKEKEFLEKENASVHRGMYFHSHRATENFEKVREQISKYFNCGKREVAFMRSATYCLNFLAFGLSNQLREGDEIVITQMEHHANIVPWQEVCKKVGAKLVVIPIDSSFCLDLEKAKKLITSKTKIVSVTHISNVLGVVNPISEIVGLARRVGACVIVDAAQSASKMRIDFKEIECDFLCFSTHKFFGLTGLGVCIGVEDSLEKLTPFEFGGSMIEEVAFERSSYREIPYRFEAGTPAISQVIAFGKVLEEFERFGEEFFEYEKELLKYAVWKFKSIENENLKWLCPFDCERQVGIFSFCHRKIHSHDVASIFDKRGICVRAGHHCCMPLLKSLGLDSSVRISLSIYNTKKDVDKIVFALENLENDFKLGEHLKSSLLF